MLSVTHAPMTYRKYSNENRFCAKWFYNAKEEPQLVCVREVILSRVAEIYMSSAMYISLIQDKQERDEAWALFRKNDRVMKHVRAGRYRSVLQAYRALGITAMKLISWFYCKR